MIEPEWEKERDSQNERESRSVDNNVLTLSINAAAVRRRSHYEPDE